MELAAATKLIYCRLALLLSVLSVCLCAGLDDTNDIFCNFTVKARSTPWYEGWCSVNGVPFLKYRDNKATPLGDLGKVVNATKACTDFTQRHHTWQVTMEFQYKQGQLTDASWNFTIDGEPSFYFNPKNNSWGVIHDKATGIMKQWQTNRELAQDLSTFSMGDSGHCLKELKNHLKEIP
ncbi:hypothetical protein A6R68_11871, partial [Neotoma lepida]